MTRSFILRAAAASVLLGVGLVFVSGDNHTFHRMISSLNTIEIAIVLASIVAFLIALNVWVLRRLGTWRQASRGHDATVLAVIAAACIVGQPAQAWIGTPVAIGQSDTVQAANIEQPLSLSREHQAQVDAAVIEATKQAQDTPGFVVSLELAIGIFIAAVIVGTTLYIIVRMVCSSLDRMKLDIQNRLTKVRTWLEHPGQTNTPAVIGAGMWRGRDATISDLSIGQELIVGFTAPVPGQAVTLKASMAQGERVFWDEFLSDFGLTDQFPKDSTTGTGVSRTENGFQVAPAGFTNLVNLVIESKEGVTNAYKSVLRLVCPPGSVVDFSDLSGAAEGRFWRLGVAP